MCKNIRQKCETPLSPKLSFYPDPLFAARCACKSGTKCSAPCHEKMLPQKKCEKEILQKFTFPSPHLTSPHSLDLLLKLMKKSAHGRIKKFSVNNLTACVPFQTKTKKNNKK